MQKMNSRRRIARSQALYPKRNLLLKALSRQMMIHGFRL
jgi:hypothetical protein